MREREVVMRLNEDWKQLVRQDEVFVNAEKAREG
jgi:hypothetical protein